MRVAVTGATGYVGRFIVQALLAGGHEVRAWARSTSDVSGFSAGITWQAGALNEPGSEVDLVDGADAVVHAAFQHVPGLYRGGEGTDPAAFLSANQDGSLRLIAAADVLNVPRFVFLSSRAVYGPRHWGRPLDEGHPVAPDTLYGAYKLAVENALLAAAKGRAWSSLRATGVHGPGWPIARTKWYGVIAKSLAGEQQPARGGTEVDGRDLAAAVLLLLQTEPATRNGAAFNVSDVYVTHRAVTRLAGGTLAPRSGPPIGLMTTDRLQSLGWTPSGWAGVVASVASVVETLRHGPPVSR